MAVRSPQDIYARHVSSSRGYPLWTPEPSSQLLSYRPEGLRIGDVGVVVPENGHFDVFFNICLPKDHRFHHSYGVPDGFSPIKLNDADIETISNFESAGQVIAATSVERVDSGINDEALPSYTFNMSSNEGALLVLPQGADSHDVRDPRPFVEQASRHAAAWYHFAEQNLGRIISHDSIYVITGFHKARSWGLAGYENAQDNSEFTARFVAGARGGGGYSWEATRNMEWRAGPYDGLELPNQSVFIRGLKIALRSVSQGVPQRWVGFGPGVQAGSSGESWIASAWRGISKTIGVPSEGTNHGTGVRVEIQHIPEISPVFHPSDVINRYILREEPSAKLAITRDSDWGSILDTNLLRPGDLVQSELLTKAVSEKYTIVLQEGVAYLKDKSGSDTPADATAEVANHALVCEADEACGVKGEHAHPPSLSVVSESNYRCIDESVSNAINSESRPAGLQSISSKFSVSLPESTESIRSVKILVISDYLCAFCYICDKILSDAIEACRDLPVHFDVEFRPFTLVNSSAFPPEIQNQVIHRNAYLMKKFGKEQAEMKLKAAYEFAQKAGLKLADDSIVCATTQAHRLSAKAYRDGGQSLQNKLNTFLFDACLTKGANISDETVLIDAAVGVNLMDKEEATAFLRSTEYTDCVEKMVEAARAHGINGVPFVIIDGKWAVNGLQPVECFVQIFRKLAQSATPGKNKAEQEVVAQ